jgi:enoyl-CoA hydratase
MTECFGARVLAQAQIMGQEPPRMSDAPFELVIEDKIARLTLNRPDAYNAMNRAFWSDLPALVTDIDEGAKARVIVISSTGKHFTSGMDVSVFSDGGIGGSGGDRAAQAEAFRHFVKSLQETFSCLERARMPVIAAVQGGCIGAGVDMISACDIRYASADAFFQIQEINIGMTADVGTFPRLCKLMPEGWVRELAYAGRRLDAAKAKEICLVNEVFETQDAMLAHVMELAGEIAAKSPVAVTGSKRMINYARDHSTDAALDYIATWQSGMFAPEHMMEAFQAKGQKRAPNFPDLAPLRKKL